MPSKRKFTPSLKLRRLVSAPDSSPPPGRNSFSLTDYYRTTRDEIHSPISRVESLNPGNPYATRLMYVQEISSEDEREVDGAGGNRVAFWHAFHALCRKWPRRCQKQKQKQEDAERRFGSNSGTKVKTKITRRL
ncbi:hypothetical protein B0H11DRAFT_1926861 [Mycena galericulata]|nr:hypothetical protein B0H11DRAFT_1926861 [Mycena galericulata]